jgi:acyl carrier protein
MTSPEAATLLSRIGVRVLAPERALEALNYLPAVSQLAIADIEWHRFQSSYEARKPRPFLDHIRPDVHQPSEPGPSERKGGKTFTRDRSSLVEALEREAARVLGFESAGLDRDLGFFEMGMDSLLAMEFRGRIESSLGIAIPATLLFDSPSIHALADSLLDEKTTPIWEPEDTRVAEAALRTRIELLSEEDAELLLLEKLKLLE